MQVKELIEKLQAFKEDSHVKVWGHPHDDGTGHLDIEDVNIYLDKETEKPLEIKDVLVLTPEEEEQLTHEKLVAEAEDRDRAQFDDGNY